MLPLDTAVVALAVNIPASSSADDAEVVVLLLIDAVAFSMPAVLFAASPLSCF